MTSCETDQPTKLLWVKFIGPVEFLKNGLGPQETLLFFWNDWVVDGGVEQGRRAAR